LGFDELIALADTLLLRAKRSGRNQVLSVGRVDNVTSLADVSSSSVA
jgi:hypothetical protein